MIRKVAFLLVVGFVFAFASGGCFLNTRERVVKRFIGHLKAREWDQMAALIDWPQSAKYVPGLPTTNEGERDAKKEVMLRLAENWTGFPVRQRTADQVRHEFLYLKLSRLEHMTDGKGWSWLETTLTIDARSKTVEILVMKINRIWRIVLTDKLFM